MRQLFYNAVTCVKCKEKLVSYTVHDYKTCSCPNMAMVDGGLSYERYGAKDLDNIWLHHYYVDQVNDKTWHYYRDYATRGSRGKDGKQPLTWIPLSKMDDDYLEAVFDYGGAEWHLDLIRREIKYREDERGNKI